MNQEILKETADTLLDSPVQIKVSIQPSNWIEKVLQRSKILPSQRVYELKPLCLGALIKISRLILKFDKSFMERNSFVERSIKGVDLNSELIIQVIALAFMNKEADPSEQLLIRIRRDFTSKDVAEVMGVVLKMMNLTSFMTAIISVRSLDVLEVKEMSPTDQRSQIASGEQLEE